MKNYQRFLSHFIICLGLFIPTQIFADDSLSSGMDSKSGQYHYETVKIMFDENSSNIDVELRQELRKKMQTLKENHQLDQVTIAGFSDQAFPPKPNRKLSDLDSNLAAQRIDSIQTTLSGLDDFDIDLETYNLGEDANLFEKWFGTSDYKLKSALRNNMTLSDRSQNLKLIKDEAEVGSAVIIFRTRTPTATAEKSKTQSGDAYSE